MHTTALRSNLQQACETPRTLLGSRKVLSQQLLLSLLRQPSPLPHLLHVLLLRPRDPTLTITSSLALVPVVFQSLRSLLRVARRFCFLRKAHHLLVAGAAR
jgi:hypothetical protein